jgi:hypothetical protein
MLIPSLICIVSRVADMTEELKALVKQLREETGSPMMECRRALIACDNDIMRAKGYLEHITTYHKLVTIRR